MTYTIPEAAIRAASGLLHLESHHADDERAGADAQRGGWAQMTEPYYSDDALAKQAALAALPEGAVAPFSMLLGICEPRVKPTDAERCNCCGLDARDSEGGEAIDGKRWCFICIGRGHHEDDE